MLAITTQSMRNEATDPSDQNRGKMGKTDTSSRGCKKRVLHDTEIPTTAVGLVHVKHITSV